MGWRDDHPELDQEVIWAEEALTKICDDFKLLVESLDKGEFDPSWSRELTDNYVPRFARHVEKIRARLTEEAADAR